MNNIKYIEERAQGIAKYSDKLRQAIKDIDENMTPRFEMAGIHVEDEQFEYEHPITGNIYRLAITKTYHEHWGIFLDNGYHEDEIWIGDASRKALIQAVDRIIPLLEKYSKILQQKEIEYLGIAAKAEAMAEAIKGQ